MLNSYQDSLAEVSRRRAFFKNNFDNYKEIRILFESENKERSFFIAKYGKLLPNNFIPNIGFMLPDLPSDEYFKADYNLPIIEGYH